MPERINPQGDIFCYVHHQYEPPENFLTYTSKKDGKVRYDFGCREGNRTKQQLLKYRKLSSTEILRDIDELEKLLKLKKQIAFQVLEERKEIR